VGCDPLGAHRDAVGNMIGQSATRLRRSMSAKSFGRDVIVTVGGTVVIGLLGLASGTFAARLLGPHGRGELAAIQTWPSVLATLGILGLGEALIFFAARNPHLAGQYLATSVSIVLLATVPVVALGYVLMPLLLAAQSAGVIEGARYYLLVVLLFNLYGMPLSVFRARNDIALWNVLRVAPVAVWMATILIAFVVDWIATPTWIATAFLVLWAFLLLPLAVMLKRRVPGPFNIDRSKVRPMLAYGLPTMGAAVPQLANLRLDQLLMAALVAPSLLGLYVVALAWSGVVTPLLVAIGSVVFPRVAATRVVGDQVELLVRTLRFSSVLALCLCAPLLALTPLVVPLLFGRDYVDAVPVAALLVVAGTVTGLNTILQEGIRGLGHPKVVLWSELTGLAATVLALVLLMPRLGIIGAAIASLLGYLATSIPILLYLRTASGLPIPHLLLLQPEDVQFMRSRLAVYVGRAGG
jgi:O-antigen/teichoic acid export membrane protein